MASNLCLLFQVSLPTLLQAPSYGDAIYTKNSLAGLAGHPSPQEQDFGAAGDSQSTPACPQRGSAADYG